MQVWTSSRVGGSGAKIAENKGCVLLSVCADWLKDPVCVSVFRASRIVLHVCEHV